MFVEKTTNFETKRNSIIDGPAAPEDVYPLCRNCTVVILVQLGSKLQYEKPKEANFGDLSCGHNISLKLKSPHGESYNFVFNSPTFSFFELELILGN